MVAVTRAPRTAKRAGKAPSGEIMVTRVGLLIDPGVSYESWQQAGRKISDVADSSAWCLGDWLAFGHTRYTDRYRRAVDAVGLDYQTLRNYAWVARSFELSRRRDSLSFQHHAEVAAFKPHEQDYWLDQVERQGWSRNELRRKIRGGLEKPEPIGIEQLPRLQVEAERIMRWREAAERANLSFEESITENLDAAAFEALTHRRPAAALAA